MWFGTMAYVHGCRLVDDFTIEDGKVQLVQRVTCNPVSSSWELEGPTLVVVLIQRTLCNRFQKTHNIVCGL